MDPLILEPATGTGAQRAWTTSIPNDGALLDARIYSQALVLDASANAAGLIVSNGGEGTIGR